MSSTTMVVGALPPIAVPCAASDRRSVCSSHSRAAPPIHRVSTLLLPFSATLKPSATAAASTDPAASGGVAVLRGATDVVWSFYEGINGRDFESVAGLIAEDCVYEDLIFSSPFVGRKAILDFFNRFMECISSDLQFVIDNISKEDSQNVGVTWHLEWKGRPFPFSNGCSFYRLDVRNGKRQIVYGRDIVEPAIKPGQTALVIIRGVTWLLQRFPQLAERL